MHESLHNYLDEERAYARAAEVVRELSFIDRLLEDIKTTIYKFEDL
jgi:hypothetical protein